MERIGIIYLAFICIVMYLFVFGFMISFDNQHRENYKRLDKMINELKKIISNIYESLQSKEDN